LDLRGRKRRDAEENCIMGSFITCTLHQSDQVKDGMGWARHLASMGEMRNAKQLFSGKPEGMNHLEDKSCIADR
jgi:hypothetical protein